MLFITLRIFWPHFVQEFHILEFLSNNLVGLAPLALLGESPVCLTHHFHILIIYDLKDTFSEYCTHKSPARVCGASAQNQATKLFRFFREDDGYNETFAAAKW